MGEAYLYPLRFEIKTESGGFVYSAQLDYGIRTVEVVRGKDEFGESFYIRLNGKPVFIKGGANIIPLHSFASKIKPDDYENIVNLAVESNMNMLRVWGGGGIYNDDSFISYAMKKVFWYGRILCLLALCILLMSCLKKMFGKRLCNRFVGFVTIPA